MSRCKKSLIIIRSEASVCCRLSILIELIVVARQKVITKKCYMENSNCCCLTLTPTQMSCAKTFQREKLISRFSFIREIVFRRSSCAFLVVSRVFS